MHVVCSRNKIRPYYTTPVFDIVRLFKHEIEHSLGFCGCLHGLALQEYCEYSSFRGLLTARKHSHRHTLFTFELTFVFVV